MKGVVYATKAASGSGYGNQNNKILEIWIEKIGICINEKNGAYKNKNPRIAYSHYGTFNVSDEFCEAIREYVETKEFFEENNEKLFKALKQKLRI